MDRRILVIAAIILTCSSCIPSLHGIVTDETRLIDDRILGTWQADPKPLVSGNYNLESDANIERESEALHLLDSLVASESVVDQWTFERMASLTFEDEDGQIYQSVAEGARSMCPTSMITTSEKKLPYYMLTHRTIAMGDTSISRMVVHLTEIADQLFLDFRPFRSGKQDNKRFADNIIMGHTFAKYQFKHGSLVIEPMDGEYILDLLESKRIRLKHEELSDGSIVLTASTHDLRLFIQKYVHDSRLYADGETLAHAEKY